MSEPASALAPHGHVHRGHAHHRHAAHGAAPHAHPPHAHPPAPAGFSLLRLSLAGRLAVAAALAAVIWGGVAWALGWALR